MSPSLHILDHLIVTCIPANSWMFPAYTIRARCCFAAFQKLMRNQRDNGGGWRGGGGRYNTGDWNAWTLHVREGQSLVVKKQLG